MEKRPEHNAEQIKHVGGVTDEIGGVDPRADENLMRLSTVA
ncbi:MAG: hypothetical protein N2491_03020 [Negativicutes bacterium]|nr:hypothetical protein [Negativicutes bacterium]